MIPIYEKDENDVVAFHVKDALGGELVVCPECLKEEDSVNREYKEKQKREEFLRITCDRCKKVCEAKWNRTS